MSIKAIKNISQVRGGSQARIMLADDGNQYVVKFKEIRKPPGYSPTSTWLVGWHGWSG